MTNLFSTCSKNWWNRIITPSTLYIINKYVRDFKFCTRDDTKSLYRNRSQNWTMDLHWKSLFENPYLRSFSTNFNQIRHITLPWHFHLTGRKSDYSHTYFPCNRTLNSIWFFNFPVYKSNTNISVLCPKILKFGKQLFKPQIPNILLKVWDILLKCGENPFLLMVCRYAKNGLNWDNTFPSPHITNVKIFEP